MLYESVLLDVRHITHKSQKWFYLPETEMNMWLGLMNARSELEKKKGTSNGE